MAASLVEPLVIACPSHTTFIKALVELSAIDTIEDLQENPAEPVRRAATIALRFIDDEYTTWPEEESNPRRPEPMNQVGSEGSHLVTASKIARAKCRIRPSSSSEDWATVGLSAGVARALDAEDVRDMTPRVDYNSVSEEEWNDKYAGRPQVIGCGAVASWRRSTGPRIASQ